MFLKFNPIFDKLYDNPILILFHIDALSDKEQKNYIDISNCIKICAGNKNKLLGIFDASLELPSTLKEINIAVENAVAKNKFNKNSAIEIKGYLINKNEKKLSKLDQFIILTEKEIQLLELFLNIKKPISKNKIL